VAGKIYASPDFTFNFQETGEKSVRPFAALLGLEGKLQTGVSAEPAGTELFVFKSYPLREVLLYMNTFSSNFVAHRIGEAVGGAEGLRQFLSGELGLRPEDLKLTTTSGLEDNAMTAQQIAAVLRALNSELSRQRLRPVDVLPMAAESASTLDNKLSETTFEKATIGKTGTFSAADGGIGMASLAGYIYTRDHGVLAFVLISEGAETSKHRKLQNDFLRELLEQRIEPEPFDFQNQRKLLPESALQIEARQPI